MATLTKEAFTLTAAQIQKIKPAVCKAKFPMINTFPHGSPLGGFGAGTLSRSPYGDFNCWHLLPGKHVFETLPGCQFLTSQKVLGDSRSISRALSVKNFQSDELNAWDWSLKPEQLKWSALYPISQYEYSDTALPVQLSCVQFSPTIPNNYQESTYPVGVFVWKAHNRSKHKVVLSLALSFENILGWNAKVKDPALGPQYEWIKAIESDHDCQIFESQNAKGILMTGSSAEGLSGQISLACDPKFGEVSVKQYFDPAGSGSDVWDEFVKEGTFKNRLTDRPAGRKASAISVRVTLAPGQKLEIPFVLAWDLPQAVGLSRFYRYFFKNSKNAAIDLAEIALKDYKTWLTQIQNFQKPILKSRKIPSWFKQALFNELYYLADGSSFLHPERGSLLYLECFDYYFYETLDVRFYGSWPQALLWPEIEKQTVLDFARSVATENSNLVQYNLGNEIEALKAHHQNIKKVNDPIKQGPRKIAGALPHDLGSPFEKPWEKVNAYLWQNSNRWKDLNSKFVLQVYRSYFLRGHRDVEFLKQCWPAVQQCLSYLESFDLDRDGLPENENFPDQTFDNWKFSGASAYCSILYLAALQASIRMAEKLEKSEWVKSARAQVGKGLESIRKKLWSGKYFYLDETSRDVMAGQLAGQWYLDLLNLPGLFDNQTIRSVFDQIYEFNVQDYNYGRMGAVNGRSPERRPVEASQGNDVWTGVNYALASHMLIHGKSRQAWKIIKAVVDNTYKRGFFFRTPESWDQNGNFIASMYMRPGAIWAIAHVLKLV